MAGPVFWIGLLAAAFLPAVAYGVWIRNTEQQMREPWRLIAKIFAWGATGGILLGVALTLLVEGFRPTAFDPSSSAMLFGAVVAAPLAEELAKALGLRWIEDPHPEVQDGLVYGAGAGLGFAATENVVYAVATYLEAGAGVSVGVTVVRTFTSVFMHATASGVIGYALWRKRLGLTSAAGVFGAYVIAVALHGGYNLGAVLVQNLVVLFLLPLVLAIGGFTWLITSIRKHDREPRWIAMPPPPAPTWQPLDRGPQGGSAQGVRFQPPTFERIERARSEREDAGTWQPVEKRGRGREP